jgi:hypothetical protein
MIGHGQRAEESGMLTLVCVATGGEMALGTRYSQDDLAKAGQAKPSCCCAAPSAASATCSIFSMRD